MGTGPWALRSARAATARPSGRRMYCALAPLAVMVCVSGMKMDPYPATTLTKPSELVLLAASVMRPAIHSASVVSPDLMPMSRALPMAAVYLFAARMICRAASSVVIWVVFVVDYVVSLWLADDRWRWFKHNLFTLLTIALPMLRPLRLLRLLTVLHVLNRTSGMAVRGRITVYAVGAVGMLMYVGALAVYSVERGASGSTITDFGTALWWVFVTVTTVGYGDFSPVTFQGKIIAVVLMFTGIALIGIVTATLASWIVDQVNLETDRREDAREKEVAKEAAQEAIATSANPEIDLLREEVRELTATVAGLRTELERR